MNPRKPAGLAGHLQFIRWAFIVAWRLVRGRWYVLRDCPDWFVLQVACIPESARDTPQLVALREQARAEFCLRLERLARDMERQILEATHQPNASLSGGRRPSA